MFIPPDVPVKNFRPGRPPVKIFDRKEDNVTLFVPDNFAYDDGLETFKLFATTQETDFSWLEQELVREIKGPRDSSPLAQFFDLAYTGTGIARCPAKQVAFE